MTEVFHHGARVIQKDRVYRPIETTDTSTIGLLYTAPNADPVLFPLNTPTLFLADRYKAADLGTAGTGHDAIDGIYDHIGVPIVGIRVADAATVEQRLANFIGDYATRTGAHALYKARNSVFKMPKILIAPGFTSQRVTGGITQILLGSGGSGYTDANTRIVINANGYGGGAKAIPIIQAGVITGIQILNCGLGYSEAAVTFAIVGDGVNATIVDFELGTTANPVVAELGGIANRLRSTIIADCPNGTAEQSVAYRRDWATERIYCVDNYPIVQRGTEQTAEPASARVAGLLAKVDNEEGFWVSPSNHVIEGSIGTSKPIDDSGVGGASD
ncbi:MAG: phage tail sheath subtilisin-like domain-containing protein, partial [Hyphomicrobium sp.]